MGYGHYSKKVVASSVESKRRLDELEARLAEAVASARGQVLTFTPKPKQGWLKRLFSHGK